MLHRLLMWLYDLCPRFRADVRERVDADRQADDDETIRAGREAHRRTRRTLTEWGDYADQ